MGIFNYIKSNIKLPDNGFIYFPKHINILRENIYENFIDSYGNKHDVLVAVKESEYIFKDEDISIDYHHNNLWLLHRPTLMLCRKLQFNLDKYYIFDNHFESDYMFLKGFFNYNEAPNYFDDGGRYYNEFKKSGFYPIFEYCCNGYGNNWTLINYLPDKLFFNFPNRMYALERISESSREIFSNIDYVNMTDIELIKFMNDRLKKRIEFENLIKN